LENGFSLKEVLTQNEGGGGSAIGGLFSLVIIVVIFAGLWKTFEKAGKPGWAAIVPVYNAIVMLEIVGRPIWWIILFFIPCVNLFPLFMVAIDMAKSFGKDTVYGVLLFFFAPIMYPILGFGDAQYRGPAGAS